MKLLQNKNTSKIKHLPTDFNYYQYQQTQIKRLKKQGNKSRLLIIALIIWNIILTCQFIPDKANIPQFTDKENQQIMIEEGIPPFDLIPINESEVL